MSRDLNKVMIIGRLGRDPEGKYTMEGALVCTFSVAAGRQWKDAGGNKRDETEWFKVVAFNKLGEICNQYLTKGARVYVEGRLQTRKYTDRDGIDRYATEVVAQDMIILSGRGERAPDAPEAPDDEVFPDEPPQARPAPSRGPDRVGAQARTSAPNAPRPPARNEPQPIESDDEIPF